jgi:hypothetical protein
MKFHFQNSGIISLKPYFKAFILTILIPIIQTASGQDLVKVQNFTVNNIDNFKIDALKVKNGSITIDGLLDESVWQQAETATGFTQRSPDPNEPATEVTEVRILYDDDAIYVGARMYDSSPDSIAATLFRRDGDGYSDWFFVAFDSYNDNRTAFTFGVTPKEVRMDLMTYNDNQQDLSWDAVWEAAAHIDDKGWTAEIRIPFSQLRYNGEEDTVMRSWGVNFAREIARKGENSFWSPTPPDASGIVSRFGRLENLNNLPSTRRLEFLPYASGQLNRTPGNPEDPFYRQHDPEFNAGADIKYGIGSNLTLTATINPDFGQAEVDPAVVNLTAFETFFPERRPFFLEGSEIFNFEHTTNFSLGTAPQLLHTRRIGRTPQGQVPENAHFSEITGQTPIAGAIKLSGKTSDGWSIGLLNALTRRQQARYSMDGETIESIAIEPLSNYSVARARRDFREGQTVAGFIFNSLYRDNRSETLQELLTDRAYSGGLDFEQSWSDRKYRINGMVTGSYISGEPEVIEQIQRSSARYYQRPDAGHLQVDPKSSSMKGLYADLMFTSFTREWLTQFRSYHISPGFEVNDMGFQPAADRRALTGLVSRQQQSPVGIFRNFDVWVLSGSTWNTAGDPLENLSGVGGFFKFQNFWTLNFNLLKGFRTKDDRLTRGGPIAGMPSNIGIDLFLGSDARRDLRISPGIFHRRTELDEYITNTSATIRYRPHQAASISISPRLVKNFNATQYVTTTADEQATKTFGNRYVFADLRQTTLSASIRLDWNFTPDLSLQLFAQPFISAGRYSRFKELNRPGSIDYDVYGEDMGTVVFNEVSGQYVIDPVGDGENEFAISNPDFNFRSLRGNAVLRWEFRPGSTMFLVWQQTRDSREPTGLFNMGHDFEKLFQSPASHTFLVKFSYWFGY